MTIRNAWYGVCLLAVAFGACDMVDARSARYADRWYYCSRGVNTEADLDFHRDLLKKAKAGGYNGMLYAHGLDYWYAIRDRRRKENFQRLRSMCAEAGVEIIPLIWSTGYGAFAGADLELAECEPATGIAYVARGGQAVFEPGNTTFANGDFAQYDRDKNRFASWLADDPGLVSFVDEQGGVNGGSAMRMEPAPGKNKYDHARMYQIVPVQPGHRYRFSLKIRGEDLVPKGGSGALRVQVYGKGPKAPKGSVAAKEVNGLMKEEGWRTVALDFSAGELDQVILYVGTWGATGGRFWVDDCAFREIGLREINRRAGTPFKVRGAASGQEYVAGRDYEMPPARMAKGGDIAFRLLPGGAIKEGERLLLDAYVPSRHGPKSQISTCMSDPRLYEILEKSAAGIMEACAPKKWFLSVDEVRNGNTCPLCQARHTDMAHILGDYVTRMHAIIKKVCPDATIYAWSDMFDPNHNAVDNYYGCKGSYEGIWDLIPKDIVMSCWYRDKRDLTVPFFTRKGFRVQAGAYYDALDHKVDAGWMDTLNRTPNATGWMYTTWNAQYELMVEYGKFMNHQSRPYGVRE